MVLSEFERRLKTANPRLHIKRYGTSMAGVHFGNRYVCRVPQGDIFEHNVFQTEIGHNTQYESSFNPTGEYRWRRLTRRGRRETAQILYTQRLIKYDDIAKIV
jgi:hypothetical protein